MRNGWVAEVHLPPFRVVSGWEEQGEFLEEFGITSADLMGYTPEELERMTGLDAHDLEMWQGEFKKILK